MILTSLAAVLEANYRGSVGYVQVATRTGAARHLGRTQWIVRLRRAKLGREQQA